jgi:two-component system nitrogen regulation sensor histidine kinase GlnL
MMNERDGIGAPPSSAAPLAEEVQFALDVMKTGIVCLDGAGGVTYANVAAEHLFGTSVAKLRRTGLPGVLREDMLTPLVTQALAEGRGYVFREVRLIPRSATTAPSLVDCHLTPLEPQRRPAGLLLELQDAKTRQRFDRDVAQHIQLGASRTMVRQMAHEIKNPLGGIRGAAQLLDRRLPENERDYTGVIIREADRLTALVNSLLGPATRPDRVALNVHEVLFDVERLIAAEASGEVTVLTDYDPSLPAVFIDRGEVVQALLNIARNALQALTDGGRLTFRTRSVSQIVVRDARRQTQVRVDVEDDGPGVPESLRDTLFYPLVTGRRDGTGLGLPTAQELINRQGGTIDYESAPGRTVFSITLPVETDAP